MIFNVLIGDLIVINIFIDLCQPGVQIARYFLAPLAHTQRDQNRIYTPNADIYVAFRLQVRPSSLVRAHRAHLPTSARSMRAPSHVRTPLVAAVALISAAIFTPARRASYTSTLGWMIRM